MFWTFENLIARNLRTLDYDDFSTVLQTDLPPTGASLCAGYNMANANMNFKFLDLYSWYRCSHQWCSMQKGVLRNFTKFIGKHMCQGLFFNKVAGLKTPMPEVLKKRVLHRCFLVNFVKFLRIPFLTEHIWTTASIGRVKGSATFISFFLNKLFLENFLK